MCSSMRESKSRLLNAIILFIKTSFAHLLSYTFERTPLGVPHVGVSCKIAATGAMWDLALAQLAVGGMITSAAADMT